MTGLPSYADSQTHIGSFELDDTSLTKQNSTKNIDVKSPFQNNGLNIRISENDYVGEPGMKKSREQLKRNQSQGGRWRSNFRLSECEDMESSALP